MAKLERGQYGYLYQRRRNGILLFIGIVLLAVAILFIGLALNKWEISNIFTVAAIVMVLPAAKVLVPLIAIAPFKGISQEEYEKILSCKGENDTLFVDVCFTSGSEFTPMHLDAIYVQNHQIIGFLKDDTKKKNDKNKTRSNADKVKDYFKRELEARQLNMVFFLAESEKSLKSRMSLKAEDAEGKPADRVEAEDFIRTSIV